MIIGIWKNSVHSKKTKMGTVGSNTIHSKSHGSVRKTIPHITTVHQPREQDFKFFDRSGLIESAHEIIQRRIDRSKTPRCCLENMDPITIVPEMIDFKNNRCCDDQQMTLNMCLLHATDALNVWRTKNDIWELDTSHIQY